MGIPFATATNPRHTLSDDGVEQSVAMEGYEEDVDG